MTIVAADEMREPSMIATDISQCPGKAFDVCGEDVANTFCNFQR
jgi:hypothetical protein